MGGISGAYAFVSKESTIYICTPPDVEGAKMTSNSRWRLKQVTIYLFIFDTKGICHTNAPHQATQQPTAPVMSKEQGQP